MNIPFVDLKAQYKSIQSAIDGAIASVISEAAFIGGKYVKNFEHQFAALYGVKHVISCGNGTDSLYILLRMLGIGQGDEVITPANSWISSSEIISQTGARPVFVDIHPEFYSMDESKLEAAITPLTRALIAVHLQGQMCDIITLKNICDKQGIALIEDCAQSHFSEFNGTRAGLIGIAGSFSFYPGKNLGAYGDAGCIITNNDALALNCRMFANHGALKKPNHVMEGINSRLDGLQAAILTAKLPYILEWTKQRRKKADLYNKYLKGICQVHCPVERPGSKHSYHLYVIRAERRNELKKYLEKEGVETAIHYPIALPNLPAYKYLGYPPTAFPVAARLQEEILSLPLFPELSEEQINYVAKKVEAFYSDSNN